MSGARYDWRGDAADLHGIRCKECNRLYGLSVERAELVALRDDPERLPEGWLLYGDGTTGPCLQCSCGARAVTVEMSRDAWLAILAEAPPEHPAPDLHRVWTAAQVSYEQGNVVLRFRAPAVGQKQRALSDAGVIDGLGDLDADLDILFGEGRVPHWWRREPWLKVASEIMWELTAHYGDFGNCAQMEDTTYEREVAKWADDDWGSAEDRAKFRRGAALVLEGNVREGAALVREALSDCPKMEDES